MKIGDNCDSNHHPLEVYVRGRREDWREEDERKKEGRKLWD